MKLFAFFTASTLLGLALASPTAVREIFEAAELDKRACTSLSYAKCHGNIGSWNSGVYCGYCVEVIGSDWAVGNHKYYAYQLNAADKSCCSYGYRTSCETNYGSRSQCPI
ncbi:hypothetical protein B0O99DRAFT_749006 [Bisporella sp. PMI_857]|nr:hypothetical protein B0O99DRAFT_749006 [Bisporella sp. PMI_857]